MVSSRLNVCCVSLHGRLNLLIARVSLGNNSQLQTLLASMQRLAEDVNDPTSQRAAFQFLGRCVTTWLEPIGASPDTSNGPSQSLPGFERFVYERLIPAAFAVLSSSQFNVKDGQMLVVSLCICDILPRDVPHSHSSNR